MGKFRQNTTYLGKLHQVNFIIYSMQINIYLIANFFSKMTAYNYNGNDCNLNNPQLKKHKYVFYLCPKKEISNRPCKLWQFSNVLLRKK